MSASNLKKSGASYEAALVDEVTEPAKDIVQSIESLRNAFEGVKDPAKDVGDSMQKIATSMKTMQSAAKGASRAQSFMQAFKQMGSIVSNMSQSIGQSLIHIGNQLRNVGLIATGLATGIGAAFWKFGRAAGDAAETTSAFNAVFRESAGEMDAWARSFATQMRRSSNETRKGLTSFRAFFQGMGFGTDEANNLAKSFQGLAVDFASFFNITDQEGMDRLLGGVAGQSENLLRFGINVQDAELGMTEFAQSIGKTASQMTQFEKASARIEIITKRFRELNIEGDAFRTRFSLQNQIKGMTSAFGELQITIGQLVEGPLVNIVRILNSLFESVSQATPAQINAAIALMTTLAAVGGTLVVAGSVLAAIGPPLIAIGTTLGGIAAGLGAIAALNPAVLFPTILAAVTGLAVAFKTLRAVLDSLDLESFSDLLENMGKAGGVLVEALDGITAAIENQDWEAAWRIAARGFELAMQDAIGTTFEEMKKKFKENMWEEFNPLNQAQASVGRIADFWKNWTLPGRLLFGGGDEDGGIPDWVPPDRIDEYRKGMEEANQRLDIALQKGIKVWNDAMKGAADIKGNAERAFTGMQGLLGRGAGGLAGFWNQMSQLEADAAKEFGNMGPQFIQDALREFAIEGAGTRTIATRQLASVGGFGASFANQAGSFAPVMDPIERNTADMVDEQKTTNATLVTLSDLIETNELLLE